MVLERIKYVENLFNPCLTRVSEGIYKQFLAIAINCSNTLLCNTLLLICGTSVEESEG
jgi:hypothetical protein